MGIDGIDLIRQIQNIKAAQKREYQQGNRAGGCHSHGKNIIPVCRRTACPFVQLGRQYPFEGQQGQKEKQYDGTCRQKIFP